MRNTYAASCKPHVGKDRRAAQAPPSATERARWITKIVCSCVFAVLLAANVRAAGAAEAGKALQIYFVDVEGGQATLFVTPRGESLLIDTGWPGNDGRDADRIVAASKALGISKIDFVLITHYHQDHGGGLPQLAAKIPIGTVVDHGENREHSDAATEQVWQDYLKFLAKNTVKRLTVKPGDVLALQGVHAEVVSS